MTGLKTRLDWLTRLALQSKNHWEAGTKSVAQTRNRIIVLTLPYLLQIIYWNKLVQDSAKTTGLGSKLFPWFHLLW